MVHMGLMGGTFNPIHLGHLLAAQEAMVDGGLDEVLFIPNQVPPHRAGGAEVASARDRYVMTCMAVSGNDRFRASPLEIDRPGVSYTADTVAELQQQRPEAELTFITGADSLLRAKWRRLDELLGRLRSFVVVSRPGFDLAELERRLDAMGLENRDRVHPLPIPGVDISATEIRRRIRSGLPYRYMVPDAVADYIRKNRLYISS